MTDMTKRLLRWLRKAAETDQITPSSSIEEVAALATNELGFIVPVPAIRNAAYVLGVCDMLRGFGLDDEAEAKP